MLPAARTLLLQASVAVLLFFPALSFSQTQTDSGIISVNLKKIGGASISSTSVTLGLSVQPVVAVPHIASGTCTSGGSLVLAVGQSGRKQIDCYTLSTNTDGIFLQWDGLATTSSPEEVLRSGNWHPPEMVTSTTSLNCISRSGSQVVRCVDYY